MSRHKVKTHHWLSGVLRSREFFFESFEEAISFISGSDHHSAKVFDIEGKIVHESTKVSNNTYA
jgi:hypothetical protein